MTLLTHKMESAKIEYIIVENGEKSDVGTMITLYCPECGKELFRKAEGILKREIDLDTTYFCTCGARFKIKFS